MTRREYEEIKEKYRKYTKRTICIESYDDIVQLLIHALENGGIEDEPDENYEPELLPCPFCSTGTSAVEYYERRYVCSAYKGGCGASAGDYFMQPHALKVWNTRATTPTEPPKVDDTDYRFFGEQMGKAYRKFCDGFIKTFMED